MHSTNNSYEISGYNRAQVKAIRSYRRKIERVEKRQLSNDLAAVYWVEEKLANYFYDHYRPNSAG